MLRSTNSYEDRTPRVGPHAASATVLRKRETSGLLAAASCRFRLDYPQKQYR